MDRLRGQVMLIVSRGRRTFEELCDLAAAAVRAGVAIVQLREKDVPVMEFIAAGELLAKVAHEAGALLLINDRIDVALAVGADGVHLGLEDFPILPARKALGPQPIIGATCRNSTQARRALRQGASYVSAGPVFASPTKPELRPRGLEVVRQVSQAVALPVCALGGLTAERVARVMAAGADLIAVSSAITEAEDPGAAAQRLVAEVRRCYSARPPRSPC